MEVKIPKGLSQEAGGSYLTVLIQEEVGGELVQSQGTISPGGGPCRGATLNTGGGGRGTGPVPRDYHHEAGGSYLTV